jgi:hypothetical protein
MELSPQEARYYALANFEVLVRGAVAFKIGRTAAPRRRGHAVEYRGGKMRELHRGSLREARAIEGMLISMCKRDRRSALRDRCLNLRAGSGGPAPREPTGGEHVVYLVTWSEMTDELAVRLRVAVRRERRSSWGRRFRRAPDL